MGQLMNLSPTGNHYPNRLKQSKMGERILSKLRLLWIIVRSKSFILITEHEDYFALHKNVDDKQLITTLNVFGIITKEQNDVLEQAKEILNHS